ncbi:MAG: sugar kinase [Lachnospiraceae bacterium]
MKFITIGEILLRLSPPDYNKLRSAHSFNVNYGGAECNVAMALANMGVDATVFTVLPDSSIGKSAGRSLKENYVHTSKILYDDRKTARMGIYFLEEGFGVRASKVIYDRANSSVATYDYSQVDLEGLLKDYDWLHLTGITPALSANCEDLVFRAIKTAKKLGLTISFDCNFRAKLWTWEQARDCITRYIPYVDVLLGIEPFHLPDGKGGDYKDGLSMQPNIEDQDDVFKEIVRQYGDKIIARHVRYVHSGSENSLKAYMYYNGHTFESRTFRFNILDRVGGGDAFASGLIFALIVRRYQDRINAGEITLEDVPKRLQKAVGRGKMRSNDIVNFAVASSVIKHTIRGDINITDDVNSIYSLMNQTYEINR